MAIAVGSTSNTPTYGTRTNSVITAPTSIANGDLLVAVLHAGNSSGTAVTVTPPAGFTEVTNSPIAETFSGYTIASHVYYKVASGESGNYTFSHSSADTEGYMYRLTGADTSTPIDVTPATSVANLVNNGTTTELATITTVTNGAFIIAQDSAWDAPGSASWSGTTPTLTTRRTGSISKLADGTLATAGATGARTRTNGNTGGGNLPWVSIIVAIRPATGGGSQSITGALYTNSNTFYGATVAPGTATVSGGLFTNSQTFYGATVGRSAVNIGGALYSNSNSFFGSTVSASYTIQGALFTDGDTFYGATVSPGSVTIGGVLFSNSNAFYAAAVSQDGAPQNISGALYANTQTVYAASVAAKYSVAGALYSDPDTFFAATVSQPVAQNISGARYDNDNSFFGAVVGGKRDTGGSGNAIKRRRNINDDPEAFAELLEEWREKKRNKQARDEEKQEVSLPGQVEPDAIGPQLYRQLLALEQAYERSMEAAEKLISKRNVRAAMTAAKELEDAQAAYQAALDEEDEEIIALFAA